MFENYEDWAISREACCVIMLLSSILGDSMKVCKDCGLEKLSSCFGAKKGQAQNRCLDCHKVINRENSAKDYLKNRNAINEKHRSIYAEHKRLVFKNYGELCKCCGEKEPLFLTVDHVENDGHLHRKGVGGSSHNNIYAWLVRNDYPHGFQILCMNCNQGKHRNGGVCPHIATGTFNDQSASS